MTAKTSIPFSLLLLTLTTGLCLHPIFSSGLLAQQARTGQSAARGGINFKPPKVGAPIATAGGASRSFCVTGKTPLTLLTPDSNLGLTTAARPTFFLYVPPTAARSAEFVLKDAKNKDLYRTTLQLTGAPGIVSLTLPESAPELQMNQNYRWYFSMICRPGDRLEDVFVSSWIQRINPGSRLTAQLESATLRDRPALFAEAGFWYDTLTALAELRRANPADRALTQEWELLLQSVGLKQVSTAPLSAMNQ